MQLYCGLSKSLSRLGGAPIIGGPSRAVLSWVKRAQWPVAGCRLPGKGMAWGEVASSVEAIPRGLRAKSCLPAAQPAAGVVSLSSPKGVQASCHRVPSRKERKDRLGRTVKAGLIKLQDSRRQATDLGQFVSKGISVMLQALSFQFQDSQMTTGTCRRLLNEWTGSN